MKAFDVVRMVMKALGMVPSNLSQRTKILNKVLPCLYYAQITIQFLSTSWFLLFNGDNFNNYVQAFFYVIHSVFLFSWYSTFYLQRRKYVQFMIDLESQIELSM